MIPFSARILFALSLLAVVLYTRLHAKTATTISVDYPEWFDVPITSVQSRPSLVVFTNTTIAGNETDPLKALPLNRSDGKANHPNTTTEIGGSTKSQNHGTFKPSGEPFDFAACLLMRDDNVILPEWLAYHYQVLPLRHLIIGLDPFALTSPDKIVEEYRREGMDITIWQEEDYFFTGRGYGKGRVFANDTREVKHQGYLWRQRTFLTTCSREFEQRKNIRWTLLVDTDEYLAYNHFDQESEEYTPAQVRKVHSLMMFDPWKLTKTISVSNPMLIWSGAKTRN